MSRLAVLIRKMVRSDLHGVSDLDFASFDTGWTETMYEGELEKEFSVYYVAEENGRIIGYAGIWCIMETADVSRIAVAGTERRRGIGAALMRCIIAEAGRRGCERVMLEVNEQNAAARHMYEGFGFRAIDLRKGYYGDGSAVIMELCPIAAAKGAEN